MAGVFYAGENVAEFVEPSERAFDNVAIVIGWLVEFDLSFRAVSIRFGCDHRLETASNRVSPISSARYSSLVSSETGCHVIGCSLSSVTFLPVSLSSPTAAVGS